MNGVNGAMDNVANHVEEEGEPKSDRKLVLKVIKRCVTGFKVTMKNATRTLVQVNI